MPSHPDRVRQNYCDHEYEYRYTDETGNHHGMCKHCEHRVIMVLPRFLGIITNIRAEGDA